MVLSRRMFCIFSIDLSLLVVWYLLSVCNKRAIQDMCL